MGRMFIKSRLLTVLLIAFGWGWGFLTVAAADEAPVEEGQPRRHEHDKAAAEQHEAGVAGVEPGHGGISFRRPARPKQQAQTDEAQRRPGGALFLASG